MICPKCHTVNDDSEKFCRNCGFQLNSSRICPTCGVSNDSNSKYCKECGTVLTPVNTFRKQIIEENTKQSFFSMYKIPLICALLIILAIGAVTGMAYYNGNSGGDDGFNTIIPTDNNSGLFSDITEEPTIVELQENDTNKTNNTNENKTLTEKVDNKTKEVKNASNTLTEKVNNKTYEVKNTSKTLTEKVNNPTNKIQINTAKNNNTTDKSSLNSKSNSLKSNAKQGDTTEPNNKEDKNSIGSDDTNSSSPNVIVINDSDNLKDTDESPSEIEMTDVPNLAKEVSDRGYSFSTIEYQGNEYTEAQCIYIFSEYLLNVENGKSSPIEIKEFNKSSNPSGDDESQTIEKSDYLSMANRVHSWMNSQGSVPDYVGVSQSGEADLSPNKMLKVFAQATLGYAVTEELPPSVEI